MVQSTKFKVQWVSNFIKWKVQLIKNAINDCQIEEIKKKTYNFVWY